MIRLLRVILLASLALPIAAAERRVLFAVLHEEKAIEPIVLLDPLAEPREENVFGPRPYVLSTDGVVTGTVRAGERIQLSCVSIAAKAELRGEREANDATPTAARASSRSSLSSTPTASPT